MPLFLDSTVKLIKTANKDGDFFQATSTTPLDTSDFMSEEFIWLITDYLYLICMAIMSGN